MSEESATYKPRERGEGLEQSLMVHRGDQPCQHLHCGLVAPTVVRRGFLRVSHLVCGT